VLSKCRAPPHDSDQDQDQDQRTSGPNLQSRATLSNKSFPSDGTSSRRMAKGIRIVKDKGLQYKRDEMNHPVSDYFED
jgi:hypothetical protein